MDTYGSGGDFAKLSKHLTVVAVFFAMVLMVGCTTTYHTTGGGLGYSDVPLGGHRYQVTVRWRIGWTTPQQGEAIGLVRAAVIATQQNYKGFYVISTAPINGGSGVSAAVMPGLVASSSSPNEIGVVYTIELTNNEDGVGAKETIESYGKLAGY